MGLMVPRQSGLGLLLNVAGTVANVLCNMVTYETILMNMCGVGNVEIWLTCSGNGAESDITMDLGPWCRCN